jgi:hypothetical protein
VEHRPEPIVDLFGRWQGKGRARLADALLGPAHPLGHRRLGHEEGAGDFGGGEASDRLQREGDLRRRRQCGVAAQQQQDEGVVPIGVILATGEPAQLSGRRPEQEAVLALAP